MAFDAFISYSSRDKTAADATCAVLESSGIRCWIAPRDIRPGEEYGAAIIEAIDRAWVMVLVFSASANESRQIHREIERAVAKGVPILPVRIEEVAPTKSMEYFLGAIHWLDALSPPLEQHLHQLADTVKAMLKIELGSAVDGAGKASTAGSTGAVRQGNAARPVRPKWLLSAVGGAAAIVLLAGGVLLYRSILPSPAGVADAVKPLPVAQAAPTTLRAAAQARDFMIGAAVHLEPLRNEPIYAQTLAQEYNVLAPEVETRFARVHPSRTEFNFGDPDTLVEFAAAHSMKMRGQPLLWEGELPQWLTKGNFSPAEVSAILKEYVQAMLRHYRGRFYSWDIAWGMLDNLGKPREFFWAKAIGPDYIEQVLGWAREADPQAKLFLNNDLQFDPLGAKSDATYDMLRKLRMRGAPVDGMALASPLLLNRVPSMQSVVVNMQRFAALGLELHMVEFELGVPVPPSAEDLQKQAVTYREYLAACLSIAACKAFLTYEFNDKYAYANLRWPGMGVGAAMPFDASFRAKPAHTTMLEALNGPRSAAQ